MPGGKGHGAGHRLARQIARDNPQAEVVLTARHYKVLVAGKIVGILPVKQAREGLSPNLRSQLSRAGVKVRGARG